jgi:hypothetical protein
VSYFPAFLFLDIPFRGISEEVEYQSKPYVDLNEGACRLVEINAAMEGLEEVSEDDPSVVTQLTLGTPLLREGFLFKTNRDGMERYYFLLTAQYLSYCSERILSSKTRLIHKRSIPLTTLLIKEANPDFRTKSSSPGEENELQNKSFVILSQEKSFHLTASTVADRNEWYHDLQRAIRSPPPLLLL